MILPGHIAVTRNMITKLLSIKHQTQPCGVDLTLNRIIKWTTPSIIDFDNTNRKTAGIAPVPFQHDGLDSFLDLLPGSYLIEFNEKVNVPLDTMGQVFARSSLWRSGAMVHAGVMDSGYQGAVGAMLQVVNPHGLRLLKDAKLAQIIFHQMSESVEGYGGVYQYSKSL